MPVSNLWDSRRKMLQSRVTDAVKRLLEEMNSESFAVKFDEKRHLVCGTKEQIERFIREAD